VEATKQKEEKRKKRKPEEQEGMPQHQHCPPAKHPVLYTPWGRQKDSRTTKFI
jgi:hypothetical protein